MYTVDPKSYANLLRTGYDTKQPLMVYGGPGIGKSEIPRQVFKALAGERNLEYVDWTDCSLEQKKAMIANPEKYFVFCDQRIGQMDSTDLRGIPNMSSPEMLETLPLAWVIYFTQPAANGVIFFDEINLAAPVVAGQAYQIINDRAVADRRLGKNVYLIAAGNRAADRAFTFEMPFPLRDRFAEVEIKHDKDAWVTWATQNKINPHLIAFISWKESYLYKVVENGADKSSTPRGIARASRFLGEKDIATGEAHMLVSISTGEAFATEFQAYVKHFSALNWDQIFKKPETLQSFGVDRLFAVVGGLAEMYFKAPTPEMLEKLMPVMNAMKDEFAVTCLRMINDFDRTKLTTNAQKVKGFSTFVRKYGKYLIG